MTASLFEVTPHYWLNLQIRTDLWDELNMCEKKESIDAIKSIREDVAIDDK